MVFAKNAMKTIDKESKNALAINLEK